MKKFLLLTFVFFMISGGFLAAQDIIPNHSFEEWDTDPEGWTNPLSAFGILNVVPSSEAQDGALSAKFIVLWDDNTSSFLPATLNSMPIPVTEEHSSLNGYFKGTSVEGDELIITVFFYGGGLIAGTGSYNTSESPEGWTMFSIPIEYLGVTPDEAYIYITLAGQSDDPHEGSEYYIDNLSWDPSSSTGELQMVSNLSLSPVPALDHLQLEFSLEHTDRMTFDLVNPQGIVEPVDAGSLFPAGPNLLNINTSGLSQGLYIVRARGERYGFVKKFVVGR